MTIHSMHTRDKIILMFQNIKSPDCQKHMSYFILNYNDNLFRLNANDIRTYDTN